MDKFLQSTFDFIDDSMNMILWTKNFGIISGEFREEGHLDLGTILG